MGWKIVIWFMKSILAVTTSCFCALILYGAFQALPFMWASCHDMPLFLMVVVRIFSVVTSMFFAFCGLLIAFMGWSMFFMNILTEK